MMSIFRNSSVSFRIFLIPGGALVLLLATALIGSIITDQVIKETSSVYNARIETEKRLNNIVLELEVAKGLVTRAPAELDLEKQASFLASFDELIGHQRTLIETELSQEFGAFSEALLDALAAFEANAHKVFSLASAFAQDEANAAVAGAFASANEALITVVEQIKSESAQSAGQKLAVLDQRQQTALLSIVGFACVFGLVLIVFGVSVARSVSRPLHSIADRMKTLSAGDLEEEIPFETRKDEIGVMAQALTVFRETATKKIESDRKAAEARAQNEKTLQENAKADAERARVRAEEQELRSQEAKDQLDRFEAFREELEGALKCASGGDFTRRIQMGDQDGQIAILSQSVNELLESIEANFGDLRYCISKLAAGDLSAQITGKRSGIFETLQSDFNSAILTLSETLQKATETSNFVSTTAAELQQTSGSMSRQAEANAASVEETSASIEEISSSIDGVVENAKMATNATQNTRKTAERGQKVSEETESAMNDITEASKKIETVAKVIEDISFQINLLALNAGVEAARAGEAGRGFSVVASEVRALAQRSQDAVQDINRVIEYNNKSVETGVDAVQQSQQALGEILDQVTDASTKISEIAMAVEQQSQGILEIRSAINSIDESARLNAASAEDMNSSSNRLSLEASGLDQLLGNFEGIDVSERLDTTKGEDKRLAYKAG